MAAGAKLGFKQNELRAQQDDQTEGALGGCRITLWCRGLNKCMNLTGAERRTWYDGSQPLARRHDGEQRAGWLGLGEKTRQGAAGGVAGATGNNMTEWPA
jgi:hypothetical protein